VYKINYCERLSLRPRICQKEAQFIVNCLLSKKEEIENIQQSYENLKAEVAKLRQVIMYDTYDAVIKQKLPEKRDELEKLEARKYYFLMDLFACNSLIAKYSRISEGKKRRGRYKTSENSYQNYL
jgi:hypothetical protein